MQLALLTREFPPEVYGGAGVHVEHLAAALAGRADVDVRVHCYGARRPSPLVEAAYQPWHELADDVLGHLSVNLAMAEGVRGADVVHSHTWYANFAGHLAKLLYGVPHVMTSHSLEPLRPWKADQLGGGYAVSQFCERNAIEAADAVIAVSGAMRDDVLAAYPAVEAARVSVIHNGIDATVYRPVTEADALARHGIDPQRPAVVFVGRLTPQKGVLELLDAAAALAPEAQVVLCAGQPDTPEFAEVVAERLAGLRRRRDGIVWLAGMLDRADVVQILSHASVFVCPSRYEPFGLVNLEAMACELPVVAYAVGGIPEIVLDGETGFLVPVGDDAAGDLASPVNALLADPEQARRMGQAGRRRVIEQFSWDAIAARTAEVYARLV